MNRFTKRFAAAAAAFCLIIFSTVGYFGETLPDSFYVSGDGFPSVGHILSVVPEVSDGVRQVDAAVTDAETATVTLFGLIPIKQTTIKHTDAPLLVPGGMPVGIKLLTDGVVVVSIRLRRNAFVVKPLCRDNTRVRRERNPPDRKARRARIQHLADAGIFRRRGDI